MRVLVLGVLALWAVFFIYGAAAAKYMDTPRLFYMHFWATDDAVALARGLKAALDQTNSQR
jgi:hypothetical protein